MQLRITYIQSAEGIGPVARTTVSNQVQLIRRAMKFVAQTTRGIPVIAGLAMPPSSPGRTRRLSIQELHDLVGRGGEVHELLPFIVRFAIATGLRRERLLEFRTSFLQELPDGRRAIVYPSSAGRRKRAGIVPVTGEIEDVIVDVASRLGYIGGLKDLVRLDLRLFPISANVFGHAWRRLLERLGISDLRFHDLRHEATSRLFERGLSAAEVRSITGHSTSEMVDRYAHYSTTLVLDRLEAGGGKTGPPELPESALCINSVAEKSPEAAALIDGIWRLLKRLAALNQ